MNQGKATVKCATDLRYNKPRYNEIPQIMKRIQNPKRKICRNIINKCCHATEVECITNQWRCPQTLK